ncbi:permease, partial [Sulfolobus sp. F3]
IRVPQASFLLAIPIFAIIFTLILQQYSIFYLIFMITTSSITMILIEASGIQLLLTLPSGLRNSFLSKLIIISLIYFISALIFTFFTGRLTGIILLPSTVASIETSLLISYNSVLKGRGIRIADPISLIIREIEINAIVGIAIVLLYINLLLSILFSLITLIIINLIVTKKIR